MTETKSSHCLSLPASLKSKSIYGIKRLSVSQSDPVGSVFPTHDAPKVLVEIAKEKGFYNGDTPANKLFNKWFFSGLEKIPEFKDGVDKEFAEAAMNFAICLIGSFAPKHQEKEAVCSLIFSETLAL